MWTFYRDLKVNNTLSTLNLSGYNFHYINEFITAEVVNKGYKLLFYE